MGHSSASRLTDNRLLAKNVLWNMGGVAGPLLALAVAVPVLIHKLGIERFGLLTLIWTFIKYFTACDFGIGTALTKFIADRLSLEGEHRLAPLVRTALVATAGFGLFLALGWMLACAPLVGRVFNIPPNLKSETLSAFYLLAFCLPMTTASEAMRGMLGALQRFDLINAVRGPVDMFSSLGLLAILPLSHSLFAMTAVLVAGRVVQFAALLTACHALNREILRSWRIEPRALRTMLGFGGWLMVSRITEPLLGNIERFLIVTILPAGVLAFYATPCEIANRLWYFPIFVEDVWFAALAHSFAGQTGKVGELTDSVSRILFLVMFPPAIMMMLFATEILTVWLGADFARNGAPVMQMAALAVLVGALRTVPTTALQAANRPDVGSLIRVFELPIYAALAWLLIRFGGIGGAALARLSRETIETAVFVLLAHRLLPAIVNDRRLEWMLAGACAIGIPMIALPMTLSVRVAVAIVSLSIFASYGWFRLLEDNERRFIRTRVSLAAAGRLRASLSEAGR
jgi:O-antigen/teichoic acid export membrane protein